MKFKSTFIKLQLIVIIGALLFFSCKKDSTTPANNWKVIYENDSIDFYRIKFLNNDTGFINAATTNLNDPNWMRVLSTEDGGITWTQVTNLTKDVSKIFPLSANVLIGTGYQVYKSRDKGKTWIDVSPDLAGGPVIDDLYAIDSLTWVVARGNEMYRTNNGGQTWQMVYHTDFLLFISNLSFPSSEIGYGNLGNFNIDDGSNFGLILKTQDGGQTWDTIAAEPWASQHTSMPFMYSLQFVTNEIGYLVTFNNYKLYKTLNGGLNWSVVQKNKSIGGYIYFINENTGYSFGANDILITNSGGRTWNVDYTFESSDLLEGQTFLKTGEGYVITNTHKVIKKIN